MIHMRQPFFSIASATTYLLCAVGLGWLAVTPDSVSLYGIPASSAVLYTLCGLMFLMAYFSLVHLKFK